MTGGDQLYWVIWLIVVNLRGVKGLEHYAAGVELHHASKRERLYTKDLASRRVRLNTKDHCLKEGEALHQNPLLQGGRGFISKQPAARLSKASSQSQDIFFQNEFCWFK